MSNNFKVGDRVELVRDVNCAKSGMKGTIKLDDGTNWMQYAVEFDERFEGGNSCNGNTKPGYGHWISKDCLKLLPTFAVGQIYKVTDDGEESGNIIRISDISDRSVCKYRIIRGNAPEKSDLRFRVSSSFANSLVLLTGSQIGEEIKKWDADHAPKPAQEYVEVDRNAKMGEKIKIVAPSMAIGYEKGDVGTVINAFSSGSVDASFNKRLNVRVFREEYVVLEPKRSVKEVNRAAEIGEYIKIVRKVGSCEPYNVGDIFVVKSKTMFRGDVRVDTELESGVYVDRIEYVVLEGYNPENAEPIAEPQQEQRKAKVGDTIKVLRDNGGPVIPESVWQVYSIRQDGSLGVTSQKRKGVWSVDSGNYIVVSSGKHRYTDSQMAEAKRIVLDTIREQAGKGNWIGFDTVGNSDDNFRSILISKGSESVYRNGDLTVKGVKISESKCGPNDEPNEWIGKCVAICKLLGKPIPRFIMDNGAEKRFSFGKAQQLCDDGDVVTIRCNDRTEAELLKAELEKLGVLWRSGDKPTRFDFFDDGYFVVRGGKTLSFNKLDGNDKFVEFSDCFTDI